MLSCGGGRCCCCICTCCIWACCSLILLKWASSLAMRSALSPDCGRPSLDSLSLRSTTRSAFSCGSVGRGSLPSMLKSLCRGHSTKLSLVIRIPAVPFSSSSDAGYSFLPLAVAELPTNSMHCKTEYSLVYREAVVPTLPFSHRFSPALSSRAAAQGQGEEKKCSQITNF